MLNFRPNPITESLILDDTIIQKYYGNCPDREDVYFAYEQLSMFPNKIKERILFLAFKEKVKRDRNLKVLALAKEIRATIPKPFRHLSSLDEDILSEISESLAKKSKNIANREQNARRTASKKTANQGANTKQINSEIEAKRSELISLFIANGSETRSEIVNELKRIDIHQIIALTELFALLRVYTIRIKPLTVKGITLEGVYKRLIESSWWLRKLRKAVRQSFEAAHIRLGIVNKHGEIYASNFTTNSRLAQKRKNDNLLAAMYVVNDLGQSYSLKELSDLNVSNPAIRKAELMVRMRGFEDYAQAEGFIGLFVTITAPSKYHAVYAKSGQSNPKYQGFTPYETNQYLCKNWQRIRAQLHREGIRVFGVRVAEPQHDGTPHWHIMLFVEPQYTERLQEIIWLYSLKEDGDEEGAKENRCDFKVIDPNKGSATGYIAKYISKNIDGEGLEEGVYGDDPKTSAQRVDAWASCWCIRQFQQIGGCSVSVWREMRRLKQQFEKDSLIENLRLAADTSNWREFVSLMGGATVKRDAQPIRTAYEDKIDTETGEVKTSYFDRTIIKAIKGIRYLGSLLVTRHRNWRSQPAGFAL